MNVPQGDLSLPKPELESTYIGECTDGHPTWEFTVRLGDEVFTEGLRAHQGSKDQLDFYLSEDFEKALKADHRVEHLVYVIASQTIGVKR